MLTALLWCDKMYKNISKKLLHLTIEFFFLLIIKKNACARRRKSAILYKSMFSFLTELRNGSVRRFGFMPDCTPMQLGNFATSQKARWQHPRSYDIIIIALCI